MQSKPQRPLGQTRRTMLRGAISATGIALLAGTGSSAVWAQKYPITAQQRALARNAASSGVSVKELIPNAPSKYVVKKGDTLWGISAKFLKRPWRWPELWGMNLKQIRNPHLIYPGQILWLEIVNGRARLRTARPVGSGSDVVRVSPRVRVENAPDGAIPAIPAHLIEPFLTEAIVLNEDNLHNAPRIVASRDEGRLLISHGDRAYAVGPNGERLQDQGSDEANTYRIFRNPQPIKDPTTQEILGYEAQYVGRARLVRNETVSTSLDGGQAGIPEAAKLDILHSKEEIRAGDRLLPEPQNGLLSYVPHAPTVAINGLVASVYGQAVQNVGQSQVITINKGIRDGVTAGDVLALISTGRRIEDHSTNGSAANFWRSLIGKGDPIKLPDERNGLLYIFRPFDRISYGLVLHITEPVKVGDRVENPVAPPADEE